MAFRHILVPTDGTAPSRRAIRAAVSLAAESGARLTALYVVPEGVAGARCRRRPGSPSSLAVD